MKEIVLSKESDWEKVAREIIERKYDRTLILFDGPMGAGKTTCIRYLLKELGFHYVTSPTFAIHHEYRVQGLTVDHLDLYRISSAEEWESTGLAELFSRPRGLVLIEWASQLPAEMWPHEWTQIQIEISIESITSRRVKIN